MHGAESVLVNESLGFLLFGLSLVFFITQVFTWISTRFKLPSVVAELLCGVFLAVIFCFLPQENIFHELIFYLKNSKVIEVLGELGIIILLLEVGLETDLKAMISAGKEGTLVALGGVIAPFIFAWLFNAIHPAELSFQQVLFIGLVFAATSIGVTARVFQDLNMLKNFNAQVVLSAAVLDDVLGLVLLSVIFSLVKTGNFDVWNIFITVFQAVLFIVLAAWLNQKVTSKTFPFISRFGRKEPLGFLVWILMLCFIFSGIAYWLKLAAIIGAFTLGATLDAFEIEDKDGHKKKVEHYIAPIRAFLVPIFFAKVGLSVEPMHLFSWTALSMILLASISKISSGWLLVPFKTKIDRLLVGVGMMPRGEVGLVILSIAGQMKLFSAELYSALLVAIIATTIIAPIWLQRLLESRIKH